MRQCMLLPCTAALRRFVVGYAVCCFPVLKSVLLVLMLQLPLPVVLVNVLRWRFSLGVMGYVVSCGTAIK